MRVGKDDLILFFNVLFLLVIGCGKNQQNQKQSNRPAYPAKLPMEVTYQGCKEVTAGPVCHLAKNGRWIDLWIQSDAQAQITIKVDAEKRRGPIAAQGGQRYELLLSADETKVAVEAKSGNLSASWSLAVAGYTPILEQEETLFQQGKLKEAKLSIQKKMNNQGARYLAMATLLLGKIALHQEEMSLAVEYLSQARKKLTALGSIYQSNFATSLCAYALAKSRHRFREARELLADASLPLNHMQSEFLIVYEKGNLALRLGDYRKALKRFTDAADLATRVAGLNQILIAKEMRAVTLQRLGRSGEAEKTFDEILELLEQYKETSDPCYRANLLRHKGWIKTSSPQVSASMDESVTEASKQALALFVKHDCPRASIRTQSVREDLAIAYLRAQKLDQAKVQLDAMSPDPQSQRKLFLSKQDLLARYELAKGLPAKALAMFVDLESQANLSADLEIRFRATIGHAQALSMLGRTSEALQTYERVSHLARTLTIRVALGQGRSTYLSQYERAIRLHLELLFSTQQSKKAFDLIRRYRTWMLRSLDRSVRISHLSADKQSRWDGLIDKYIVARDRLNARKQKLWGLTENQLQLEQSQIASESKHLQHLLDEAYLLLSEKQSLGYDKLPQIAAGDLLLSYYQIDNKWVGFAADGRQVVVQSLGPLTENLSPKQLSQILLEPFKEKIEKSTRIVFLPSGKLDELDLHALPWKGSVLLKSKPVVFSLDLHSAKQVEHPKKGKRALVVTDPERNLPKASQELPRIVAGLSSQNWNIETLGGEKATLERVVPILEKSDLFHYSGHAEYAGIDGWDSCLHLAAQSKLRVGDILVLTNVPKKVVLLGCETGRSNTQPVASVSLAYAFLVAGARVVVASRRPVSDRLAAQLTTFVYSSKDIEEATRRFQLEVLDKDASLDWSAFRIFVR